MQSFTLLSIFSPNLLFKPCKTSGRQVFLSNRNWGHFKVGKCHTGLRGFSYLTSHWISFPIALLYGFRNKTEKKITSSQLGALRRRKKDLERFGKIMISEIGNILSLQTVNKFHLWSRLYWIQFYLQRRDN